MDDELVKHRRFVRLFDEGLRQDFPKNPALARQVALVVATDPHARYFGRLRDVDAFENLGDRLPQHDDPKAQAAVIL
ncbi:MAG: hypothetical protein ACREJC_17270 [Tepidisphaeraceae bacterium]